MTASRPPSMPGLLAFEALARLRSVTLAGEELSVTPSAISHRIKQLEAQLGVVLFGRSDFTLSHEGALYLARVREALALLAQVPGRGVAPGPTRLRVAVTPTFSRQILLPRLALFRHAYPEIELVLQVTIPVLNVSAEEADIELRFGPGPQAQFSDRESVHLAGDVVTPVCSPDYLNDFGPFDGFDTAEQIARARLIRSPLEPWRTWFTACGITQNEPLTGAQFNDIGLVLDAAVAGFGVALIRLKLGAAWLDSGRLLRLSSREVPSPHHYFLCWKPGALQRWECAAFVDWLQHALA
ncbi:LysR substrate-binding domain-containing protein [Roseateles koreensis]|uniref:LysR substrate-binding domain-containing protein n=1 Tax=Roseateles koreensis TaxID=2987526 RepID=A0ABT5KX99_9BURK|nr:LysR substrate-binding domain-containing protein [Roseateles koreensis]MDC8786397.1 LysR substrate-binding domain-containing protein [Roseateles koreensis]